MLNVLDMTKAYWWKLPLHFNRLVVFCKCTEYQMISYLKIHREREREREKEREEWERREINIY